jgi:hypothetical protein
LRLGYARRQQTVELQGKTDSKFPVNVSFLLDTVPLTAAAFRDTIKGARSAINYNKGEQEL